MSNAKQFREKLENMAACIAENPHDAALRIVELEARVAELESIVARLNKGIALCVHGDAAMEAK